MKTPQSPASSSLHRATQAAAILTSFVSFTAALPQATAASSAGSKDHVLFVGTDLAVKEGNEFYHVVGANKNTLKIEKDHALEDVRLGRGANIRINRGVKLSNLSATIANVQTESFDRASARAQLAAIQASMMLMEEARDQADRIHGQMVRASTVVGSGEAVQGPGGDSPVASKIGLGDYVNALTNLDTINSYASTLLTQNSAQAGSAEDEVTLDASALPGLKLLSGSEPSDSALSGSANSSFAQHNVPSATAEVDLTFDISSPTPLDHAYIVVVANYGSSNKPDEVARQISAKEFGQIDSHPQRVKMRHAASVNGLPFRKFDMGLYANGQEVATNLSEKRLALTSDQAFQFFLIDYLSAHKGATLSPTPVLMTPRTEFRRQVENTEANQTIYANVDKTGNVVAMSTDAAGTQRLPAAVELALQYVRFMPALEKGTPVDGRVKVTLAQLEK